MIGGKICCVLFVNCLKDTDRLKVIGQEKICQDIPIKRKTKSILDKINIKAKSTEISRELQQNVEGFN